MANMGLPIWTVMSQILGQLVAGTRRMVIAAATGSGKSTQIVQAMDEAGITRTGMIYIVQPRRVAARALAKRVAQEMGVQLGREVGYIVRFDDHKSAGTRICFVTEGVLLQMLRNNPELAGVSAVILDEFHERSLNSDLLMALIKKAQEDGSQVKLLVMSATIDTNRLTGFLGGCPVVDAPGRLFPIDVHYTPGKRPVDVVAEVVEKDVPGDILIFQPGKREIEECVNAIARLGREDLLVLPLHGELQPEEQDRVFDPTPAGLRKIVVSTNVAETSITIDGIRIVIDTGTARVSEYEPSTGIIALKLRPISQASTDQRKGRAGRTAPGTCYRLWNEYDQTQRPQYEKPEFMRMPLALIVLMLKKYGYRREEKDGGRGALEFLDNPAKAAWKQAKQQLTRLGAVDPETGWLTERGEKMADMPLTPQLAAMLIEAEAQGCLAEVASIAAILPYGRRVFRNPERMPDAEARKAREAQATFIDQTGTSDVLTFLNVYEAYRKAQDPWQFCRDCYLAGRTLEEIRQVRQQVISIARKAGMQINREPGTREAIIRSIAAGLLDNLFVESRYYSEFTNGVITAKLARESVAQTGTGTVVAAYEVREIPTARGGLNLLCGVTVIDLPTLKAVANHLIERRPSYYDEQVNELHCFGVKVGEEPRN